MLEIWVNITVAKAKSFKSLPFTSLTLNYGTMANWDLNGALLL